jgi:hypothetical protein
MGGDSQLLEPFLSDRKDDKVPAFVVLTLYSNGLSQYSSWTLRELLGFVHKEVEMRDSSVAPFDDDVHAIGTIKYRDIRRMESVLTAHEEPAILVRRHCVLLLLDPVRAVVMSDRMHILVPDGADSMIGTLTNIIQVVTYKTCSN